LVKTSGANGPWAISNTITKAPAITWGTPPVLIVQVLPYSAVTAYQIGARVTYNGVEWTAINTTTGNAPPALALNAAQTGLAGNLYWTPSVDPAHAAVAWTLGFTAVFQDANGITYESAVQSISYSGCIATDRPLTVILTALPTYSSLYTNLYYKLYRGQNGVLGYISAVTQTQALTGFVDLGNSPDYTQQPPTGTDPFLVNGADSYPSVVGYIDQRRAFADQLLVPNQIQTSATGNLYRYDEPIPGQASDASTIVLASDVLEQIRSFLALKCNLVFTGSGEWVFPDQVYTRFSGGPRKLSSWGSSWLDPVPIGNGCLFNTVEGNQVRDFFPLYGIYTSIWDGDDLTATARHFFEHHTITAWAFQTVPYPVLWMARDDGVLISVTYERATQSKPASTVAWAQHYTGVGPDIIESIAVVPEPPEMAVYVIVNRTVGGTPQRFIERMSSPIPAASTYTPYTADVRYANYLDCSTQFDGHQVSTGSVCTLDSVASPGATGTAYYTVGKQITLNIPYVGGASPLGFLSNDPGNSNLVFDPENLLGAGTFQAEIIGYTSANTAIAQLLTSLTQAQINLWAVGAGGGTQDFGIARSIFSVPQLAGQPLDNGDPADPTTGSNRGVTVLIDGVTAVGPNGPNFTLVGSTLTLGTGGIQTPGLVVNVGLSYNADLGLLDAYHPNAEIRNKYKKVDRVGFEVAGARSLWVGPDTGEGDLTAWNQRSVQSGYSVMGLQTGYFSEFIKDTWGLGGDVTLRHIDPLPCIVVSVLRELALGGD